MSRSSKVNGDYGNQKYNRPFSTAEDSTLAMQCFPYTQVHVDASEKAREKEQGLGKCTWLKSPTTRMAGCRGQESCLSGGKPLILSFWGWLDSITNGQWFSQSCLCNKASIKTHQDGVKKASGLMNTWRRRASSTFRKGVEIHTLSLHLAPRSSSTDPFIRNLEFSKWAVSLSSMSSTNKLIEPKEGSWELLIYRHVVRNTGYNLDLQVAPEEQGGLMALSP